jgi:hypothetical protein
MSGEGWKSLPNNCHANNVKSGANKGKETQKTTSINSAFKAEIQIITIHPNLNKEQVEI